MASNDPIVAKTDEISQRVATIEGRQGHFATKDDFVRIETELKHVALKENLAELKGDLQTGITTVKGDLQINIATIKGDLQKDIAVVNRTFKMIALFLGLGLSALQLVLKFLVK